MIHPLKHMWFGFGLNCAIVVMHSWTMFNEILQKTYGKATMTLFLISINAWAAWFLWHQIKKFKAREKQRVIDILSGNIG